MSLRVVLHIDRVTLRGVTREQREAVVEGLREGLAEAFAQPAVVQQWAGSGHRERVRGSFTQPAEASSLGEAAAQQLATGGTR